MGALGTAIGRIQAAMFEYNPCESGMPTLLDPSASTWYHASSLYALCFKSSLRARL